MFARGLIARVVQNGVKCKSLIGCAGSGAAPSVRTLALSAPRRDLMEFFDDKKNWGEQQVRVGRSWRVEELRLKSNTDLHKLWYILLKEKNMLLTMEHACKEECELFPNPERIDKVEESMRCVEEVVRERNRAYYLLETGTTGERPGAEEENFLGLPEYRQFDEHALPKEQNKAWLKAKSEEPVVSNSEKRWFLSRWAEKQLRRRRSEHRVARREARLLIEKFPDLDREALKAKFPDVDLTRTIQEMEEKYLGNVKPKKYFWNRDSAS